ncbi:hypothetical protein niasHT_040129 [Heterodera trifolii]|uniref:BTB domain-containing protein n=1 Tax=Heterodera trifolii TaxID=157864 RepID=A0ABD2HZT3_9BILA
MAVKVPDVEPKAFQVMLSFIYSGDLDDLNGDNAMAVLYAADFCAADICAAPFAPRHLRRSAKKTLAPRTFAPCHLRRDTCAA